jgi:ketosteroid isomerase-like protein
VNTLEAFRLVLASAILLGAVETAVGQSSASAEVLAALTERDKAYLAGDDTEVAQFMSDDYLQTSVSGKVQDKQAWLKEFYGPLAPMLRSGKTRYVTFERGDIVVRDLGETVVVAGTQTLKHVGVDPWDPKITIPADSPKPPLTLRFTHVWIKRSGAWKLAVVHNAIPRGS